MVKVTDINEPPMFDRTPQGGVYRMEVPENSNTAVEILSPPKILRNTVLSSSSHDTSIFNVSNKGGEVLIHTIILLRSSWWTPQGWILRVQSHPFPSM